MGVSIGGQPVAERRRKAELRTKSFQKTSSRTLLTMNPFIDATDAIARNDRNAGESLTGIMNQLNHVQHVHIHFPGGVRGPHRRPFSRRPPPRGRPALPPSPRCRHVAARRFDVRPAERFRGRVLVGGWEHVGQRPPLRELGRGRSGTQPRAADVSEARADVSEAPRRWGAVPGGGPHDEVAVTGCTRESPLGETGGVVSVAAGGRHRVGGVV